MLQRNSRSWSPTGSRPLPGVARVHEGYPGNGALTTKRKPTTPAKPPPLPAALPQHAATSPPLVRSEGRKALVGERVFLSPEVGDSTTTIFLKLLYALIQVECAPPSPFMKRIEFALISDDGASLQEPIMVEDCSQLPYAIMHAVEDFLEAHDGQLHLPITIRIQPTTPASTC